LSSHSTDNQDVAALMNRSELNAGSYHTFLPSPQPEKKRSVPPSTRPDDAGAPHVEPLDALPAIAKAVARGEETPDSLAMIEVAARMLTGSATSPSSTPLEADWQALPTKQCTAFVGLVGGAGTTTIMANAAAALASIGKRVVLADRGPSLLPFYFGGRSFRSSPASFVPRGAHAGPIHLATGPADAASDDWLRRGVAEFQLDADLVLLNGAAAGSPEGRQWTARAANLVLLLTPSPASLLRLPAVLDEFRRLNGNRKPPSLLLNQFDRTSGLHAEIRSSLSKQFGEHLLPFVIRRDEAFPRCLAAGGSVAELMPESEAAADIQELIEWMRNNRII
jgi:cellulose biosynthesis protein BcsQ